MSLPVSDLARSGRTTVVAPPPPPKPIATAPVKSKIGDTLATVGQRYGVTPQAMARANPGVASATQPLRVGTDVAVPVGEGAAATHTVAPGETAAEVAKQHGVTEQALREANDLPPGAPLRTGQQLLLPAGSTTPPDEAELRDTLADAGLDLSRLSPADQQKALDAARQLRDGDVAQKLEALATLGKTFPVDKLPDLAEALGVKDTAVLEFAANGKALGALATLANPNAKPTDKVAAALTLASAAGGLLPKDTQKLLDKYLAALPAGAELSRAIGSWTDPNAGPLDKARAALDVAKAAQKATGKAWPELANSLRAADSFTKSVGAALTLLDPEASVQDKAQAAADLVANVPGLKADAKELADLLRSRGVANADEVLLAAGNLAAVQQLPKAVRDSLDPQVLAKLSADDLARLNTLAADPALAGDLAKALKNLHDPASVASLAKALADGPGDAAAKKAVLSTLAGMRNGEADKLLAKAINGQPAAEVLAKLSSQLDEAGQKNLAKLMADFSDEAGEVLLKMADADPGIVKQLLKFSGEVDGKLVSRALEGFSKVLGKVGVEVTGEVAQKLARTLGKVVPALGAVPALAAAWDMAAIARDTSLPPDIRYLALQAAKLNTADAVLSVVEAFTAEFGVPIAADIGIAGAELAMELIVGDQLAKYQANPAGYEAPLWLSGVNVAIAAGQLATNPLAMVEFVGIYGASGSIELLGRLTEAGGTAAIHAAEALLKMPADVLRQNAHAAAQGLHLMADVLRNPDKYGAAAERLAREAVNRMSELAQGAGELAKAAGRELKGLVTDLKNLGEQGVKQLAWIASHPGEAAEAAAKALGDLAQRGIELGTEAGRRLAQAALAGLGRAQQALQALGQAASAAYQATVNAVGKAVDTALAAGQKGIETLAWIANHPGAAARIAGDALVDIASSAGQYAKQAYDAIVDMGDKGIELGRRAIDQMKALGETGLEMLEYAAQHPGEVASALRQAAGEALAELARLPGRIAEQATDALLRLVDQGVAEVKDTVVTLLSEGGAALQRAAEHWKDAITEGGKEILGGLADLGDAGKDALESLARWGVGAAADLLGKVFGWLNPFG